MVQQHIRRISHRIHKSTRVEQASSLSNPASRRIPRARQPFGLRKTADGPAMDHAQAVSISNTRRQHRAARFGRDAQNHRLEAGSTPKF
jgi:hypothetical protein